LTISAFARDLIRKTERSLQSARELQDHDFDGSVNRSYYAMFNIARATLLSTGVPERDLPRTRSGVIAAFAQHAVHSGRVHPELAAAFGRAETLRLRADYTGTGIDLKTATDTLAREFALDEVSKAIGSENGRSDDGDKVSEPGYRIERIETPYLHGQAYSLEEERRKARENWLRLRQQSIADASHIGHKRDADRHLKYGLGYSQEGEEDP
jgi:uncharacterized protein (UPF0332 family)